MAETLQFTSVYDDATAKFLENEFLRLKDECYLDHAGATLYSDTQIKKVTADLHGSLYANPHSVGIASSLTQDIIERMRYRILSHFNTNPDEYNVIFTSGATASLKSIAEGFRFAENVDNGTGHMGNFVYVQDNHTSVLGMRDVIAARGTEVTCLGHDRAFQVFGQHSIPRDLNEEKRNSNSLFVYSAQCNFSGLKYPLKWIKDAHTGALSAIVNKSLTTRWYVLLDAAGFAPTNNLDLSIFKPDFVCLSFYKMFGYPTGIGALLVKNSSSDVLGKIYYGGGTVDVALSSEMFHKKRQILHQRFEDGTVPFLSIAMLQYGFEVLSRLTMDKISKHVFSLAKSLHRSLLTLHHYNGKPVVKLYSDTDYEARDSQGGVVTFNLIRSNGEYVGYMEVINMAALFKIHLRTGCFCNPGACQRHLSLSPKEILQNYEAGYTCGGTADLINGKPTGAIRISFGYMSTIKDVRTVLLMITKCFIDEPCIRKFPRWWEDHKTQVRNKYTRFYSSNILDNHISYITNSKKDIISNHSRNQNFHDNEVKNLDYIINSVNSDKIVTRVKKCTLQQLFIYPIKSCGAYEITDSWNLNVKGLEYDREWMIITSSGICLTQKHQVNLCLLKPVIFKQQRIMKLTYPGMPAIDVPLENTYKTSIEHCQSRVCESRVQGIDCGSEVSEWLSLALGKPNLKLIRQSQGRQKKGEDKAELSFSSQAQYLLINEASVSWLSDKVSDDLNFKRDTAVHRFRGNIIVGGNNAFDETQWKYIRMGNNNFKVNGPCTRCQMICIDQTTGKKTVEPLRTLAEEFHGKLRFGIYLTRLENSQGTLKIGDNIYYS